MNSNKLVSVLIIIGSLALLLAAFLLNKLKKDLEYEPEPEPEPEPKKRKTKDKEPVTNEPTETQPE